MNKFILCPALLPLLLLVFSSILAYAPAEVITLTPDTLSDKVKEKDTAWFVKFCVPWCKHCKNLGTLWEDLGKAMEGEDEIEVGEVDCGTSKPLCSKVDIHSYPTFKLFYDGEEVANYKGRIFDYMRNQQVRLWSVSKPLHEADSSIINAILNNENNFGPRDVESLKSFVLEEAEKATAKAQLDNDLEL